MHKQQKDKIAPLNVFISYAHEDEAYCNELKKHLSSLQREGLITTWHDREIAPGVNWSHEIDQHLNTASLILLLVSPDFIHSDYCYGKEMERALKRHSTGAARVIPLLLRPVDWESGPLGGLLALPTDACPITDWPNRDRAFKEVAKGIRKAVTDLSAQRRLQHRQWLPTPSENISQRTNRGHILPADSLENMIQQALSVAQFSPLTSKERNVIYLFFRGMPSRQIAMLLRIWRALNTSTTIIDGPRYVLGKGVFLTWRQLPVSVRNGLLHLFEEVLEVWLCQSAKDREEAIEGLILQLIHPSLENLRTFLENFLQEWNDTSEQERMEKINTLSQSWDELSEQERTGAIQGFIQELKEELEDPVEIVEVTLREWKAAWEDFQSSII